ncbi:MAG: cytochrome c maturation protein CcmE [Ilumatobacteraceae bacterium]
MDLSPRTLSDIAAPGAPPRRKRPWAAIIVLALVLVAGGVAVSKFLSSAIDYYCNVNEIGVKSGCTVGRELRIQGTVDQGSIRRAGDVTFFSISFEGQTMPVQYQGGQVDLFQECIPVVIHGRVVGASPNLQFDGTDIEVKHSSDYQAQHPDRVDANGKVESAACSQQQA